MVERLVGLVHHAGHERVQMRRACDDVQADVDLMFRSSDRQPERVVEQDLGSADLDQQRGQTGQIRQEGAGQLVLRVVTGEVVLGVLLDVRAAEQRIDITA
jgi:hypothetical protein